MANNLTLADAVVSANTGLDAIKRAPIVEEDTGIKCLRIQDVNQGKDFVSWGNTIVEKRNFEKFQLKESDILIARTGGSVGSNRYIYQELQAVYNNGLIRIRVNTKKHNPKFIYYLLQTKQFESHINGIAYSTSAQPNMKIRDFLRFEFKELGLNVENTISEILSSLDAKIELNRLTNQTLEQMAQALFKSWFVDFDPVIDNALAAGNAIPDELQHRVEIRKKAHALQKQNPNIKPLPAATQRLFPSEFEHCGDNTLGIQRWIPKGWKSDVLASMAELSTSRMDGVQLTLENYISTENMLPYKQGVTKASSIPQLKTTPSFKAGQVLISNIRPYFKKIWLANREGGRSNDVLGFDSIEPRTESYILNLLSQDKFFDFMMTTAKGSKMPRGDKKAIMDWGVVVPPVQIRQFYSRLVGDFYSANSNRVNENNSLSKLRDALLPKLISGELQLPQEDSNYEVMV